MSRNDHDAQGASADCPARVCDPGAAARLSCRRGEGDGRRSAPQSGQERHGRVNAYGPALFACLLLLPLAAAAQTARAPAAQSADPSSEQVFIKPATIDNTLEVTGDPVAAKEINTRMQVGVLVNGKG